MKKPTDFTRLMTSYLCSYLPLQRNVSQNTITSYCDTFRLFLTFLRDEKAINIERVRIRDFSPELVREYLSWLEQNRGCGISTRICFSRDPGEYVALSENCKYPVC